MTTWSVTVIVERDGEKLSQVTMHESPLTIGSSPASHVVLADPEVGWQHARVVVTSGRPRFLDRSLGGSFRGGERLLDAALSDGDVISIPPFSLRFTIAKKLRSYEARPASLPQRDAPPDDRHDTQATREIGLRRATATPSPWTLELTSSLREAPHRMPTRTFSFTAPARVLVGRHPDADVTVYRQSVSRRHAQLTMSAGGRCLLKSLTKTSWVRVNGRVIDQTRIEHGDVIELGSEVTLRTTLRARPRTPDSPGQEEDLEAPSQPLRLHVKRSAYDRRVHVCVASGRVDAETCVEMRDALTARIDRGIRLLVVDLSDCDHVDETGLGVLVITNAALASLGGRLRLAGVSLGVRDELTRLGLDGHLPTFSDEESATIDLLADGGDDGDHPGDPATITP